MEKTAIDIILDAYRIGKFPMADSRYSEDVYLYDPPQRCQIPILGLHVSRSLKKLVKQHKYRITVNKEFPAVIYECAQRPETWINQTIEDLFNALHMAGHAHSLEVWNRDGEMVGGLYGLALGGVFCGESMFSRESNTSKIALVHLCARLWHTGFSVLDAQFMNPHLVQFGAHDISRQSYLEKLGDALHKNCRFDVNDIGQKELVMMYFAQKQHENNNS